MWSNGSQLMISTCTTHQHPRLHFDATEEVKRYIVTKGHFSSAALLLLLH